MHIYIHINTCTHIHWLWAITLPYIYAHIRLSPQNRSSPQLILDAWVWVWVIKTGQRSQLILDAWAWVWVLVLRTGPAPSWYLMHLRTRAARLGGQTWRGIPQKHTIWRSLCRIPYTADTVFVGAQVRSRVHAACQATSLSVHAACGFLFLHSTWAWYHISLISHKPDMHNYKVTCSQIQRWLPLHASYKYIHT
jgi:hypothetical protein